MTLKVTQLTVAGATFPVGNSCETSPFTIDISSGTGFSLLGGGPLSGDFTIPPFSNCAPSTEVLLNLTIPGPGNTLNLKLGALQIG